MAIWQYTLSGGGRWPRTPGAFDSAAAEGLYDGSSVAGRTRRFLDALHPQFLMPGKAGIEHSSNLLRLHKEATAGGRPSPFSEQELWTAWHIRKHCTHPDTGEPLPRYGRLAFSWVAAGVCSLTNISTVALDAKLHGTTPLVCRAVGTGAAQLALAAFAAEQGNCGREGKWWNIMIATGAGTVIACGTEIMAVMMQNRSKDALELLASAPRFGMRRVRARALGAAAWTLNFGGVAGAAFAATVLARKAEWEEGAAGAAVRNDRGEVVGRSAEAGWQASCTTGVSRAVHWTASSVVGIGIMQLLDLRESKTNRARLKTLRFINLFAFACFVSYMIPVAPSVGLFDLNLQIPVRQLEPELREQLGGRGRVTVFRGI
eukprot:TRINITY_DN57185_c0_g1_i1.p1 TRINITY_DN57185_c0_g1~~TRINITY_DN57185_c0_g1_i1.p1  ORF type:complete len:404 (+),score=116.81 TRINITY_DN57185_c0_g1_i1:93-1214(+)